MNNAFYGFVFNQSPAAATATAWPPLVSIAVATLLVNVLADPLASSVSRQCTHRPGNGRFSRQVAVVNHYGLFSIMTTSRLEIIVEGSRDGKNWLPYEFKFKPGDLKRAPPWVAPHQPRLDWQMWFAALSDYRLNSWFIAFLIRLLQGSAPVVGLLKHNPFPELAADLCPRCRLRLPLHHACRTSRFGRMVDARKALVLLPRLLSARSRNPTHFLR
jgi:hypothetical protein